MEKDDKFFASLGLFLGGGLVGAFLALLYAPKPGVETRKDLKEKLEKGLARAEEAEEKLEEKVKRFTAEIR